MFTLNNLAVHRNMWQWYQ